MINIYKKLEQVNKRIDKLKDKNLQLVLDMITDLDNNNLFYKIKVLDKNNKVIQEDVIKGIPREYIDKYIEKYKINLRIDLYNIQNGNLVYIPTLLERDKMEQGNEKDI